MKKLVTLLTIAMLTGCAGANISSQVRESGTDGSSMMLRCLNLSTGSGNKMNIELQKYDGWKMVYVSEYTTENKTASASIMCFEKPAK